MEKLSTNLFIQISIEYVEGLRTIVRETLASGIDLITNKKPYSSRAVGYSTTGEKGSTKKKGVN